MSSINCKDCTGKASSLSRRIAAGWERLRLEPQAPDVIYAIRIEINAETIRQLGEIPFVIRQVFNSVDTAPMRGFIAR